MPATSFEVGRKTTGGEQFQMLTLSREALNICTGTVRQLSMPSSTKCLRLIDGDDGVAMSFELPRSDDELVHHQGSAVLAVPDDVADKLSGMELDVRADGNFVLSEREA